MNFMLFSPTTLGILFLLLQMPTSSPANGLFTINSSRMALLSVIKHSGFFVVSHKNLVLILMRCLVMWLNPLLFALSSALLSLIIGLFINLMSKTLSCMAIFPKRFTTASHLVSSTHPNPITCANLIDLSMVLSKHHVLGIIVFLLFLLPINFLCSKSNTSLFIYRSGQELGRNPKTLNCDNARALGPRWLEGF